MASITFPTARELAATPASVLASEIVNVNAVLAARYSPNGTFSELADDVSILGKAQGRVPFVDLIAYRTALYLAQTLQAAEPNGIGIMTARFHDNDGGRRRCDF